MPKMTRFRREPVNIVDLMVRELSAEVPSATVRRVLRATSDTITLTLQDNRAVLLPDFGVIWVSILKPRRVVSSNLPHLRCRQ